jgi:hypothetical protein
MKGIKVKISVIATILALIAILGRRRIGGWHHYKR